MIVRDDEAGDVKVDDEEHREDVEEEDGGADEGDERVEHAVDVGGPIGGLEQPALLLRRGKVKSSSRPPHSQKKNTITKAPHSRLSEPCACSTGGLSSWKRRAMRCEWEGGHTPSFDLVQEVFHRVVADASRKARRARRLLANDEAPSIAAGCGGPRGRSAADL